MDKLDLAGEYKDLQSELGDTAGAAYKFFSLFKVVLEESKDSEPGLHWLAGFDKQVWDELEDDDLRDLRRYLKETKAFLREKNKNVDPAECRRKMWFWVQKLMELAAFERSVRREIILWMDICDQRTFEGCKYRIDYEGGKPSVYTKHN